MKPEGVTAKVAHTPPLPKDLVSPDGVEVRFVEKNPDKKVADRQSEYWYNVWLKERLVSGKIVPTPRVKLLEGGLGGINKALDEVVLLQTKGAKLVLEL